jgi:sugar/nucleoside kinase (ribokinase family)
VSGYFLKDPLQAAFAIKCAKTTRLNGGFVMLDASPIIGEVNQDALSELLSFTHFVSANSAEVAAFDFASKVPFLIRKSGKEGATLESSNHSLNVPAENCAVVDTTGAGDAFNAGFIAAFLQSYEQKAQAPAGDGFSYADTKTDHHLYFSASEVSHWLKSGNQLAAKVISKVGATTFYDL